MIKYGRMSDFWHGNGVFASLITDTGHKLVAIRPLNWRIDRVEPPAKPGYVRWYFGPFEFELFNKKSCIVNYS